MIGLSSKRPATWLEVTLIAVVMLCLPLFEAPKNVFSVLFLVVWAAFMLRSSNLGCYSRFELPILGLAAVLWFAPVLSNFSNDITPLNSAHRWTLIAIFAIAACRLDYTRPQVLFIMSLLMIGGVAAVIESFWVWSINGKPYPEFRSVGHVNHSSMYSLVPLAAGMGALIAREGWFKVLGVLAVASTLAFLPPSRSLVGGVSIASILFVGTSILCVRRWRFPGLIYGLCVTAVVVACVLATPFASGVRQEFVSRVNGSNFFSDRDKILNSALAVWDRHPLLGTGWFSFGAVTSEEEVRSALLENGLVYDPSEYAHYEHGHNLWTTMLIERGLIGVVLVTVLLLTYFWTFLPVALSIEHLDQNEVGLSVSALLVAVGFLVAGLGNTTMMNEHGHAGMALIAVCYGYLRGRGLLERNVRAQSVLRTIGEHKQ